MLTLKFTMKVPYILVNLRVTVKFTVKIVKGSGLNFI